jgi:hypothetical protein
MIPYTLTSISNDIIALDDLPPLNPAVATKSAPSSMIRFARFNFFHHAQTTFGLTPNWRAISVDFG